EEEEKEARLEQKRDLLQINTSLIQLGRALRNVEIQIRDIENNRLEILGEKNEYIARIKDVLETLVKDPMEREIISSFFYKTVQSLKDGISIKEFLSDIYLKFPGSRAGIDYTGKDSGKKIPEYIKKQEERIKMLEETLTNIIEGFDFIKIVYDESCGEKHIYFDF
ncbi:MAG: hypothetical protein GY870_01570, partial [archaeon]|nr:hypothetical protein [archaeon]